MSNNIYKKLEISWSFWHIRKKDESSYYDVNIELYNSNNVKTENLIKDVIKPAVDNNKGLFTRYNEVIKDLNELKLNTVRNSTSYIGGKSCRIKVVVCFSDAKKEYYAKEIYINLALCNAEHITQNLNILKCNCEYELVVISMAHKIDSEMAKIINNYHKKYRFSNIYLEEIEKIDPDKIECITYDINENPERFYEVISQWKTSNKFAVTSITVPLDNFEKEENLHFYNSGSILYSFHNINFNFRYNLFFTISHSLNLSDQLVLNPSDDLRSNLSDDLLSNPLVLMKIAKFSHVKQISK